MSTQLRLDADGQRLICEGGSGPRTACGRSGLPERGRLTGPLLLRAINFDPMGPDKLLCNSSITAPVDTAAGAVWPADDTFERDETGHHHQPRSPPPNSFTFQGTYYTVFVKVATCDRPQGKPITYFNTVVLFVIFTKIMIISDIFSDIFSDIISDIFCPQ